MALPLVSFTLLPVGEKGSQLNVERVARAQGEAWGDSLPENLVVVVVLCGRAIHRFAEEHLEVRTIGCGHRGDPGWRGVARWRLLGLRTAAATPGQSNGENQERGQ
jgi:hypothetical protein